MIAIRRSAARREKRALTVRRQRGFTLLELVIATMILLILTSMVLPLASFTIKRAKEKELRQDLWMMRDAIDRYKDAADRGAFQTKVDSQNYPPDLDTLVKGSMCRARSYASCERSLKTP